MAYSPSEKYPGAVDSDPNYQGGKFRDNNPSTTNNGSPLKAIDRNELLARDEAIMNDAGFEYNGLPDTPQDSQMFRAYKASLGNGANLLSNHNFLIQTPDDSQPLPSPTPTSYPPGHQIFSGVFANETSGITNLTYIDGRVSFSGGDIYFAVPNTGVIARLDSSQLVASVADFDGKPRTRGVSFGLVGDEYRVTVGIDALEDSEANETLLGSVKFEQGSVATRHEAQEQVSRINLRRSGLIFDNATDQTQELIEVLEGYSGNGTVYIDVGGDLLASWQEVSANMPTNVILNTTGVRTGFRSDDGSYNNKVGIAQLSRDEPNNDSYSEIASGGNVGIHLLNTGVNGVGTSGEKRLASLLYSNRYLNPTQSGRRGYMSHAIVQVGQSPALDKWHWHIRKLAPWDAASADYFEFWTGGVTVPSGAYCRNNNTIYKTTLGGVTGSNPPIHTSGSASDGGVNWEWFDAGDGTIFSIDENGSVRGGKSGNTDALLSMIKRDEGGAIVEFGSSGESNDTLMQLRPTNSGGGLIVVPYLRATSSGELKLLNSTGVSLINFHNDRVVFSQGIVKTDVTSSDNASSISVSGVNSVVVSNSSGTNLSSFTDGFNGQEVTLVFGNGNTTLIHGSGFLLSGSSSITMGTHDCITLRKFSYTGSWVEVSRSIK